jgi:murein DD-endopeptidase MepM/ murein hydrolase activator NlpD
VKLFAAGLVAVIVGVMLLPAVLLGGDGDDPTAHGCGTVIDDDHLAVVLTTIRTIESGGDYQARSSSSTASGAYQMIDGTWRTHAGAAGVDTAVYPSAWTAPADTQDAVAANLVKQILADHHGHVELIPVAWYLPAAIDDPTQMDVVPDVGANTLTPRQYQTRWIVLYRDLLADAGLTAPAPTPTATNSSTTTTVADVATRGGCVGGQVTPLPGGWSLPGPRSVLDANPDALDDPHHDYPAWDWIIPTDTPIYAVRGGHLDTVRHWPHNWWAQGCGEVGGPGCDTCGVGVTIVDDSTHRWTYCHGSTLTVALGDRVAAGQQIMWSGNTGRSGTPHLHLELRTGGIRRCPQPLLQSLYHHGTGIDPATLPATGCSS